MDVSAVDGFPDTYLVDNRMFGIEGALATYVVDADRAAILDAGTADTTDRTLAALDALGVDPAAVEYLFVSHLHLDHAGGAGELAARCENATVVVHERGRPYLTDRERLDRLVESTERAVGFEKPYGDPDLVPRERCLPVSGGESFDLGDRTFEVYDAPGHAPHHYVTFDPTSGLCFAADAVGSFDPRSGSVVPSTPPPNFDLEANLATVDRLRDVGPEKLLFSHFGPGEDAAAELDAYAEVLTAWVEAVRDARERVGDGVSALTDELTPEWESPTVERDIAGVCRYLSR